MRRGFIVLVAVLALALVPAMLCAQYSAPFGITGLPSLPSCLSGNQIPGFAPEIYFGWGIPQIRNMTVALTANSFGADNIQNINLNLPLGGFWIGASLPVALTDHLAIVADGWYLASDYVNLTTNTNTSEANFVVGYQNTNMGSNGYIPPLFGTNWQAKPYWWFVDGALAYGSSAFSMLAGCRFDYTSLAVTNPSVYMLNSSYFSNEDEADMVSRAVMPYIGFQSAYRDTVQNLSFRLLGLPTVLGSSHIGVTTNAGRFQYGDTDYRRGYFYEAFAEYTRKFWGASQGGVFARWNTIGAESKGTGGINMNNNNGLVGNGLQDTYALSFYR
ncbi:MAG: hypothetical protein ACP5VS_13180, partial [Desulfomonilaceae bacterium]